uniref:RRM domain-containing protein n=1 Tax=Anopheles dirus TaxID=7168 RepID=A0A182MZS4_9DIPT
MAANGTMLLTGLHGAVEKQTLLELLGPYGQVQHIELHCEPYTHRSLGYATLRYAEMAQGEQAIAALDGRLVMGLPIRLQWLVPEGAPALRLYSPGHVVFHGLDQSYDLHDLMNAFARYGRVVNCTLRSDRTFHSLGYGSVLFALPEEAVRVVQAVHITADGRFQHAGDEPAVVSAVPVAVEPAVAIAQQEPSINGPEVSQPAPVNPPEPGQERQNPKKKRRPPRWKAHNGNNCDCAQLYVSNLPLSYRSTQLYDMFERFGKIVRASVIKQGRVSLGFGFICFDKYAEAAEARRTMHLRQLRRNVLNVQYAHRSKIPTHQQHPPPPAQAPNQATPDVPGGSAGAGRPTDELGQLIETYLAGKVGTVGIGRISELLLPTLERTLRMCMTVNETFLATVVDRMCATLVELENQAADTSAARKHEE